MTPVGQVSDVSAESCSGIYTLAYVTLFPGVQKCELALRLVGGCSLVV